MRGIEGRGNSLISQLSQGVIVDDSYQGQFDEIHESISHLKIQARKDSKTHD